MTIEVSEVYDSCRLSPARFYLDFILFTQQKAHV